MPKITVEIEVDSDTGQVRVGVEPPDEDAGAMQAGPAGAGTEGASGGEPGGQEDDSYLQPAASIDEALAKAKELLSNPQAGVQPGVPDKNAMWNKVQRDRAMAAQPGGPLMGQPGA